MSFEIMHFRGAQDILKSKNMKHEVQMTMEYLDEVLYGSNYKRELLRQALEESGWRENGDLTILDGRRSFSNFLGSLPLIRLRPIIE